MHLVYLIIALILNAIANILMKLANVRCTVPSTAGLAERITGLYLTWPFIAGLIVFGLNLLFYTQALNKMALSVAYPIMTGAGFAIIGITGYFVFSERLSTVQVTGMLLILFGITLIARSK